MSKQIQFVAFRVWQVQGHDAEGEVIYECVGGDDINEVLDALTEQAERNGHSVLLPYDIEGEE